MLVAQRPLLPILLRRALISLRYSQRLCQGAGLTWTDGERVEGYTDLLWVLLNAPATCLGFDPIAAARLLGLAGTLLALWAVSRPPGGGGRSPRVLSGALAAALTDPSRYGRSAASSTLHDRLARARTGVHHARDLARAA